MIYAFLSFDECRTVSVIIRKEAIKLAATARELNCVSNKLKLISLRERKKSWSSICECFWSFSSDFIQELKKINQSSVPQSLISLLLMSYSSFNAIFHYYKGVDLLHTEHISFLYWCSIHYDLIECRPS